MKELETAKPESTVPDYNATEHSSTNPFDQTKYRFPLTCFKCGKQVTIITTFAVAQHRKYCDPCGTAIEAERAETERQRLQAQREAAWRHIQPPLYRDTNIDDPRLHSEIVTAAKQWNPSDDGRGLLFSSRRSGIGKTRCMFWTLQRYFMQDYEYSLMAVTHGALCEFMRAAAMGEIQRHDCVGGGRDAAKKYHRPSILFIDDFRRGKFTDFQNSELFELLEHRTAKGLSTCITTNYSAGDLAAKFASNDGDAILRRIGSEFNNVVHL